jgi:hypothetical protein
LYKSKNDGALSIELMITGGKNTKRLAINGKPFCKYERERVE